MLADGPPKLGRKVLRADMSDDELRTIFDEIDTDRSGMLDVEEVDLMARRLGHELTDAQLAAAMDEMDADGSGEVDFDEFVHWWREFGSKRKKRAQAPSTAVATQIALCNKLI